MKKAPDSLEESTLSQKVRKVKEFCPPFPGGGFRIFPKSFISNKSGVTNIKNNTQPQPHATENLNAALIMV
jgi:hypothetical protein